MTNGFLLGKFMPLHAGHLFLCEVARARVDRLTVLLCSHDAEPIPGVLRAGWMRECLAGTGIRLCHMHRDIPQVPEDHPDFWAIWKAAIAEYHPEAIDWVFGSEPYVRQLAATLGARPYLVDPERLAVPVSASAIVANPAAHWTHVPPAVRGFFQKRVTLLGPESAGKTTLGTALAARFETLLIPEYGRDYDVEFRQGRNWTEQDFQAIAEGHIARAGAIARRSGPVVIEDTDLLQTVVWAEYLLGSAPSDLLRRLEAHRLPALYLLLGHEPDWVDDGTRYSGEVDVRAWFHSRLVDLLQRLGARWTPVGARDWPMRAELAESAVAAAVARAQ